jgi:hypothetical protein
VVHEEAAAFALDALDRDESDAFERHLAMCPDCEDVLEDLRFAAAALAFAVQLPVPGAGLRLRVIDFDAPVIPLIRRPRPRLLAAASIAAACAVVVGALRPWQGADSTGGMHRYTAEGAKATLLVGQSGDAVLAVRRLPPRKPGTAYEIWVIAGGRAEPAGMLRGPLAVLTRPVPSGATVAVSIEPSAGSSRPTGPLLLRARTT